MKLTITHMILFDLEHLGQRRLLSFPIYMDLQARIDSFDLNKWPHFQHEFLAADKMAQCGLFYTGLGDKVACYKCGIGLHKWEEDDVPREVHARYSSDCKFD